MREKSNIAVARKKAWRGFCLGCAVGYSIMKTYRIAEQVEENVREMSVAERCGLKQGLPGGKLYK
jgi:hypothetical protein